MEDRHKALRELPFIALAAVLQLDLTKFRQRKNGTEWTGNCPIHNGKKSNTAFSFNDSGKFNCFSCRESGRGGIDLVMKVRKVGFQAAVELLEATTRTESFARAIEIAKMTPTSSGDQEATQNEPRNFTYEKYKVPSPWLAARGFTQDTLDAFGVFQYDNPARASQYRGKVMIRVQRFVDGATVAYLARDIRTAEERGTDPKYIWPTGFHRSMELFGAFQLKAEQKHRVVYVAESPFTVLAFHQKGVPCVAAFGWSISPQQAEIISHIAKGVVFLPDKDKYENARSFTGVLASRVWTKTPSLPDGVVDPESLSLEQIKALA